MSAKSEGETESVKKLRKRLKKEGYSDEAIEEICEWYK